MKPIHYTRHARSRMRQHRISEEDVALTIKEPEQLLPSIKNRYNALRRISNKIIRVTFIEEDYAIIIITVSPRKHFQGGVR
jgi:uncharacterized sporulation protein YeaH/YhbH (DUF444 family)